MKTNPVYKRECMVSARSFKLALVLLVFNGILALVALLNMYSALAQVRLTAEVQYTGFLDLYMFVASLEFLMLILIMPAVTAGSISGERERQTLDLMLTTCMTPADIVLGKLEAALGTMFLMVVSSLPILAMVFVYGGVTASDLLLLVCCFFAAAVFMGSIGLCCSALFRRTTAATVAAYAVTAVLTAGTYGINFLVTYINQMQIGEYLASAESGGVSSGSGRSFVCAAGQSHCYLRPGYRTADSRQSELDAGRNLVRQPGRQFPHQPLDGREHGAADGAGHRFCAVGGAERGEGQRVNIKNPVNWTLLH